MSMAQKLNINELDLSKYLEKLNLDSEAVHKEWDKAGVKPGLQIWRIENFKVVPWPEEEYGKFYSGDSYIVMNTYKKNDTENLYHDIHFWLGATTTADEAGTAAYKTVELDNFLGTSPIQHREIQGSESELFLSYFKQLIIMEGGIESGFKKVKPIEYKPQLFHIKSKFKTLTCTSVPVSTSSLNAGDVFVLDLGLTIYQWNGGKAAGIERYKAMEFTSLLKSERNGKPQVAVFNQDDNDSPFWSALGGKTDIMDGSVEDLTEEVSLGDKILFRLSNSSGAMVFSEEARNDDIKLSLLDPDDVFIFDTQTEVFVWIGQGANVIEKTKAFQYAMDYVKDNNKPVTIPITRVVQGNENQHFKSFFNEKK